MRSLTLKLTLAFLFVSIVGVVLVAVVVRQRTASEFDQFVLNRYQIDLIDELSAYYERQGSWDNFSSIVIRTANRYGPQAGRVFAPVTLSDADGHVIFGGIAHQVGEQLTKDELKNSVPVKVDDDTVGWVLFTNLRGHIAQMQETPESQFLENVNRLIIYAAAAGLVKRGLMALRNKMSEESWRF